MFSKKEDTNKTVVKEVVRYLVIPERAEKVVAYELREYNIASWNLYGDMCLHKGYTLDVDVAAKYIEGTSNKVQLALLYRTTTGEYVLANKNEPVKMYDGGL